MRIGVIGCGNIGRIIVEAVYNGTADCEIAGVFDICEDGFYLLPANIMGDIRFTTSFDEFLNYDFGGRKERVENLHTFRCDRWHRWG
ncbi:MAG: hypothetical protein A7316_05030 [Candidatus Altiarchaeales archaeon WOR_SM1_86-2]|nr:MAG: hypothetical protein A7316_05030 [Candidatus Altiarchaeales archaeon WOR_SM1_86-2]